MDIYERWLMTYVPEAWRPSIDGLLLLAAAAILGWIAALILLFILRRIARRPGNRNLEPFHKRWRGPIEWALPLLFVNFMSSGVDLPPNIAAPLFRAVNLLIIAAGAWFAIRTVRAASDLVQLKYDIAAADNLTARKMHTQMRVFEKVGTVIVVIVAVALMLMTFEQIRHVGVSIFASAGVAGIVLGFAAQKTLGTFIAGLQIAVTQPIRIDDVVIVEGEWGVIEEITLTYVVVRIWDLRRLVLPITYFIEKPFQNWTRVSSDLLGTIFLHTDYRIPLEELRLELKRIVESTDLWDGKSVGLIVFDAKETTLHLRALISARNAGAAWELRCLVREKLIDFIQRKYPEYLPRFRAELGPDPNAPGEPDRIHPDREVIPEAAKPRNAPTN